MAMRSATLPCPSTTFEGCRPLTKICENTHRVGKCEAPPCHLSLTLTTSTYVSSLEVPGHASEPGTFFDAALGNSSDETPSDDGSFQDDDSTSTYGDDDHSFEAGSAYSDDCAYEDDISTCSDHHQLATQAIQVRSWSVDKPALEFKYRRAVNEVVEQTFMSAEHAGMLLRSFRWNIESAVEAWYSKEGEMNKWLGLDDAGMPRPQSGVESTVCSICMEECEDSSCAACEEHHFCKPCWTGYIDSAIGSGSGKQALELCCPHRPEASEKGCCPAAVSDSMILSLASPAMRELFIRMRLESLVEADRSIRWCPSPGCSFAVQIDAYAAASTAAVEVQCLSGHSFCWACGEEPHSPVDCETARMWMKLNNVQGEEISVTLESIKDCPQCHIPIEKVGGCSHVECQCTHKFCWDCMGELSAHADEDCAGEVGDGPDVSQLKDKTELVSPEENSYGRFLLKWLECEGREKQMKVVLQDILARSEEWNVSASTGLFIVGCWRQLKWMQARSYFGKETSTAFLSHEKQAAAQRALESLHEAVLDLCKPSGSCKGCIGELEAVTRTQFLGL